jgi:hypothetical protein
MPAYSRDSTTALLDREKSQRLFTATELHIVSPVSPRRNISRVLFWMILVSLAIRFTVMAFVYQWQLDPAHDYWSFGAEEGRVARAIANGRGFSDPLWGPSGPTAWFAPVYPLILGATFKIFGVYTKGACLAILFFNSVVEAFTCIPIFLFARHSFDEGVAKLSAWIWVFFPDAIYPPLDRIWDTWLATFLLALLFALLVVSLEHSSRVRDWVSFGLLSGIAALTMPVLLSVLPLVALWMVYRLHQQRKRWFVPAISAVFTVILVLAPWFVRNYRVFHHFIPLRDCFGMEFLTGNNGDSRDLLIAKVGPWLPWLDSAEWNKYASMGETAYFDWKGEQAAVYVKAHPVWYAGMVGRRVIYWWTNFWSFSADYRRRSPSQWVTGPLCTILSILALLGLWRAFREKGIAVGMPYAIALFFFPLVYYFTAMGWWYRRPLDPFFVALVAYTVAAFFRRRRQNQSLELIMKVKSAEHRKQREVSRAL